MEYLKSCHLHDENMTLNHCIAKNYENSDNSLEIILNYPGDPNSLNDASVNSLKQIGEAHSLIKQLNKELELLRNALSKKEHERAMAMEETESIHKISQKETFKLIKEKDTAILANEKAAKKLELANKQVDTISILLNNCNTDRENLSKELAQYKNKVLKLIETIAEKDSCNESLRLESIKHEQAYQLAIKKLLEQQNISQELEAEIFVARGELERRMENFEAQLTTERSQIEKNRRKCKVYLAHMAKKMTETMKKVNEKAQIVKKTEMEALRATYENKLREMSTSNSENVKYLEEKLKEKATELMDIQQRYSDKETDNDKRAVDIKISEQNMSTTLQKVINEREEYKRLRESAKRETLSLAERVEEQSDEICVYSGSMKAVVFPSLLKIEGILREIEWSLHSMRLERSRSELSCTHIQNSVEFAEATVPNCHGAVDSYTTDSRERNLEDIDTNIPGELGYRRGSFPVEKASSSIKFDGKSTFHPRADASRQADELQNHFSNIIDSMKQVSKEVEQFMDWERKKKSVWAVFSDSIRHGLENCFAVPRSPSDTSQHIEIPTLQH